LERIFRLNSRWGVVLRFFFFEFERDETTASGLPGLSDPFSFFPHIFLWRIWFPALLSPPFVVLLSFYGCNFLVHPLPVRVFVYIPEAVINEVSSSFK